MNFFQKCSNIGKRFPALSDFSDFSLKNLQFNWKVRTSQWSTHLLDKSEKPFLSLLLVLQKAAITYITYIMARLCVYRRIHERERKKRANARNTKPENGKVDLNCSGILKSAGPSKPLGFWLMIMKLLDNVQVIQA